MKKKFEGKYLMGFDRITQFACFYLIGLLAMFDSNTGSGSIAGHPGGGVLCQDDVLGMLVDSSVLEITSDADLIYVMVRAEGLRIYDVSDPMVPVQVGSFPLIGSMLVDGDRLIISSEYDLHILDVSDPSAPMETGFFAGELFLTFPSHGWTLVGDVVYMASSQVGLMLFDIRDPANIVQLETYGGPLSVFGVLNANSVVYVVRENAIEVLDVSDPRSPTLLDTLDRVGLYQVSDSAGSLAYLASDDVFSVFDISDPVAMNLVGSMKTGILMRDILAVRVVDERVYLSSDGSMEIIDVHDPANPVGLGTFGQPWVRGVEVHGDVAFVVSEDGVVMVDVSEPDTPEVGFAGTAGAARSVVVKQGYAYVVDEFLGQSSGSNGLRIVDISNPRLPTLVGTLDLIGPTRSLVVDGSLVYTADGYFGFHVIDVSEPESPIVIGGHDTGREAVDLAVAGSMVYVADSNGLLVFDASDSSNIEQVATIDVAAVAVLVASDVLYVVEDRVGVMAFDISDPGSPTELGSFLPTSFYSSYLQYGLTLDGDRLFVVGESFGMIVLDVHDPGAIQLVDQYESFGQLNHGVFADGGMAYVVDDRFGLQLVDLDAPGGAALAGSYHVPWGASDVDVVNGLAYVVDDGGDVGGIGGLHIVNITSGCSLCAADLNVDGSLNFSDVSLFLSAYSSRDPMGDFDGNGRFNFFDVSAFLSAFGSGCL